MNFVRKHRKISIIVLLLLIVLLGSGLVFSRYVLNLVNNYILETKGFYFNSTVLNVNDKGYSISNWNGVDSYTLTIDLNNRKSESRYTKSDINYNVYANCPNTVTCVLSKTEGILYENDHTDTYQLIVTPNDPFSSGEEVTINTYVESTAPYRKRLSATYKIGVEKSKFSYEIVDEAYSKFLKLNLTNAITYYEVETAFGSHSVGDIIKIEEYSQLTPTEQANCYSAIVTLTFDPTVVFLDMTDDDYIHRLSTNYQEQTINGHNYVKKFSFKVNATSTSTVLFYKDDITMNYTYPVVNNSSIIQVDVNTVS